MRFAVAVRETFMRAALEEAHKAFDEDEVPIGAVVVCDGRIISRAHNMREKLHDPTAHAEILAMRAAASYLGGWRLHRCDLYVTVEPCPMCAGAIVQARINCLVYGTSDEKAGCCGTVYNLLDEPHFNHRTAVVKGVLQEECHEIMSLFFKRQR